MEKEEPVSLMDLINVKDGPTPNIPYPPLVITSIPNVFVKF